MPLQVVAIIRHRWKDVALLAGLPSALWWPTLFVLIFLAPDGKMGGLMGTHIKATVFGVLVGLLSAVLGVFVDVFLPVCWELRNKGGGLASASVGSGTLLVAFIGVVVGFLWIVSRARRRHDECDPPRPDRSFEAFAGV